MQAQSRETNVKFIVAYWLIQSYNFTRFKLQSDSRGRADSAEVFMCFYRQSIP
jgi:hypothetical protein